MARPSDGFPRMVADDSELEGLYRFFGCEEIEAEDVLAPHIEATFQRMREVDGPVLVLHDSTDFSFGGHEHRAGLGRMNGDQQGFIAHVALAVVPGEERIPLGTCGLIRISRTSSKIHRSGYEVSQNPERESLRWAQLATRIEQSGQGVSCIHVMDREADNYDLFATLQQAGARFVVRARHDRALVTDERLFPAIEALTPQCFRNVEVSERRPRKRARETATFRRPNWAHSEASELTANLVRVWEPSPPEGEPAVSWLLYTSEPIKTRKQLLAIVDYYRSRWLIEELFKALKTGCSIEKRQLETYRALAVALAVFLPVAWRLLLLRAASRKSPELAAKTIVTDVQLKLLRHKLNLKELPKTVGDAALAIAKLGGHLKRNGPPGWQTLGRGLQSLLLMEAGWRAAVASKL